MTLLLAGHETTATGLAWAFDLLFRAPDELDRLREEVADGGHEYLDAVIERDASDSPRRAVGGTKAERRQPSSGATSCPTRRW